MLLYEDQGGAWCSVHEICPAAINWAGGLISAEMGGRASCFAFPPLGRQQSGISTTTPLLAAPTARLFRPVGAGRRSKRNPFTRLPSVCFPTAARARVSSAGQWRDWRASSPHVSANAPASFPCPQI